MCNIVYQCDIHYTAPFKYEFQKQNEAIYVYNTFEILLLSTI